MNLTMIFAMICPAVLLVLCIIFLVLAEKKRKSFKRFGTLYFREEAYNHLRASIVAFLVSIIIPIIYFIGAYHAVS